MMANGPGEDYDYPGTPDGAGEASQGGWSNRDPAGSYLTESTLYGDADRSLTRELIQLCRQLSAMLATGTEILRALAIAGEQAHHPGLRDALEMARNDMTLGWTLWLSLQQRRPDLFSPFFIGMIRQGERDGVLAQALQELADTLERDYRMNADVPRPGHSATGVSLAATLLPAGAVDSVYRLAIWMGAGLVAAAVLILVGAGSAAAVASAGLALAGWGALELRRTRISSIPAGKPVSPIADGTAPIAPPNPAPSRRSISPEEAFPGPPQPFTLPGPRNPPSKVADRPEGQSPANGGGTPKPPTEERRGMPL
jgi:hypothetical protein